MRLDLMRDKSVECPTLNADELRYLRVWHCKFKSLKPIEECINLEELIIGSYPDKSLDIFSSLQSLKCLAIVHMPKVTSLQPLSHLAGIESLSLATSPSWDAAGKKNIVDSLEPITKLPNLKYLELFGISPPDGGLEILKNCKSLVSARFSNYRSTEIEQFYAHTGVDNAYNPPSSFK